MRSRRLWPLVGFVAVSGLVLAACSGSGTGASGGNSLRVGYASRPSSRTRSIRPRARVTATISSPLLSTTRSST